MDTQPEKDGDEYSWVRGLALLGLFLVLLVGFTWLVVVDAEALEDTRVQLAVGAAFLVAIALAFVGYFRERNKLIDIDKRGWMDMTRLQWRKRIVHDWDETDRRSGGG